MKINNTLSVNWKAIKLNELVNLQYGKALPANQRKNGNVSVYGSNGIVGYHDKSLVENPTIIIGRKGSAGKANFSSNPSWIIDTAFYIEIINADILNLNYLYYFCKSLENEFVTPKGVKPGINRDEYLSNKIPLPFKNGQPDIAEQKRIADKLDKLFAEIDKAIKNTQTALEYAEKILQSELQKIFNKTTTKDGNNISLEDERYFYIETGSTPKTTKKEYWNDGNVIWITPKDLGRISSQEIDDSERKITVQGLKNCSASLVPKGSIVISTRAPIGYVAVAGRELCFNQGCKAVVIKSEHIFSKYLYYAIIMAVDEMKESGKGSTFKEISKSKLGKITVLFPFKNGIPDMDKQRYIADRLDKIYLQSENLKQKYREQLDCWFKLKQSLLNKAFQGEL